jgi:hypothetical protein
VHGAKDGQEKTDASSPPGGGNRRKRLCDWEEHWLRHERLFVIDTIDGTKSITLGRDYLSTRGRLWY